MRPLPVFVFHIAVSYVPSSLFSLPFPFFAIRVAAGNLVFIASLPSKEERSFRRGGRSRWLVFMNFIKIRDKTAWYPRYTPYTGEDIRGGG